jgi:hypothetical protein
MAVELAERELAVQQAEREAQTQILIAEQGNWVTRSVRPLWALPFILFTWKIIVWDKLLGWGVTDALDEKMWSVFMIMVAAYFGGRSAEKVATTVAGVFKRKPGKVITGDVGRFYWLDEARRQKPVLL